VLKTQGHAQPVPGSNSVGGVFAEMEASPRPHAMYYRCPALTLAPGSPVLAAHPPPVYLREDPIQESVNKWLGGLFDSNNVDRTVAALVASQAGGVPTSGDWTKKRLADAAAKAATVSGVHGHGSFTAGQRSQRAVCCLDEAGAVYMEALPQTP
jgi:hypothetical protein